MSVFNEHVYGTMCLLRWHISFWWKLRCVRKQLFAFSPIWNSKRNEKECELHVKIGTLIAFRHFLEHITCGCPAAICMPLVSFNHFFGQPIYQIDLLYLSSFICYTHCVFITCHLPAIENDIELTERYKTDKLILINACASKINCFRFGSEKNLPNLINGSRLMTSSPKFVFIPSHSLALLVILLCKRTSFNSTGFLLSLANHNLPEVDLIWSIKQTTCFKTTRKV